MPRLSSPGKWLGLVAAIWVQAICGHIYTFSNYSAALKSLLQLNQLQLNNLSVAKDVGKAFGLLAGLVSDHLPPSVILTIGSLEAFLGYGGQWLVVSQRIKPLPYWQMCVLLCMGGNSSTWMNTAVLVTCIRNFSKNRGPVSGILKGYLGISSAIFTNVSSALFSSDPSSFLLMLTIVPAVTCLVAAFLLHETDPASTLEEENREMGFFHAFNAIAITLAVYLLVFDVTGFKNDVVSLIFFITLLVLLASPLLVPLYSVLSVSRHSLDAEIPVKEPLLSNRQPPEEAEGSDGEVGREAERRPVIGEDHNVWEMVRTLDFWILFLSFLCGVGTGMCVINNMAQIGLALGHKDASIFISLISVWGFFGRIFSGLLSEYCMRKFGTPRPLWNAASQILMAAGFVAMAVGSPGSLYIGSIIVGMCYGVRFTVTVPIASEMFGLKYYGILYNILVLDLPLGSFLFSGLLAGYLYDAEATPTKGGGNICVGSHCYRMTFFIMAVTCLVGFGFDIFLMGRTKKIYQKYRAHQTSKLAANLTEA